MIPCGFCLHPANISGFFFFDGKKCFQLSMFLSLWPAPSWLMVSLSFFVFFPPASVLFSLSFKNVLLPLGQIVVCSIRQNHTHKTLLNMLSCPWEWCEAKGLYWSARPPLTEYHWLGSLNNRPWLSTVLEARSSRSRCWKGSFLLRAVRRNLFSASPLDSGDLLAISGLHQFVKSSS